MKQKFVSRYTITEKRNRIADAKPAVPQQENERPGPDGVLLVGVLVPNQLE